MVVLVGICGVVLPLCVESGLVAVVGRQGEHLAAIGVVVWECRVAVVVCLSITLGLDSDPQCPVVEVPLGLGRDGRGIADFAVPVVGTAP